MEFELINEIFRSRLMVIGTMNENPFWQITLEENSRYKFQFITRYIYSMPCSTLFNITRKVQIYDFFHLLHAVSLDQNRSFRLTACLNLPAWYLFIKNVINHSKMYLIQIRQNPKNLSLRWRLWGLNCFFFKRR